MYARVYVGDPGDEGPHEGFRGHVDLTPYGVVIRPMQGDWMTGGPGIDGLDWQPWDHPRPFLIPWARVYAVDLYEPGEPPVAGKGPSQVATGGSPDPNGAAA